MTPIQFTICLLFYGDHADLCERLLASLSRDAWCGQLKIRIGCNACSKQTRQVLQKYLDMGLFNEESIWWRTENIRKYPMMRMMFYGEELKTPYVMWFDDDSWVLPTAPDSFFDDIATVMQSYKSPDMLGAIWYQGLRGNQHLWIRDQPWYTGKPVQVGQRVNFATGGWWTIRTELLQRWNWPDPQIDHNGGDVMLGALLQQQQYRLQSYTQHLAINADSSGKCSSAPRRGESQQPVGEDYQPPKP